MLLHTGVSSEDPDRRDHERDADRHVDQKCCTPGDFDENTADDRSERRRHPRRRGPDAHRTRPTLRWHRRHQQRPARGCECCRADGLQHSRGDENTECRCACREGACRCEHDDSTDEAAAVAQPVARGSQRDEKCGVDDRVGRERPTDRGELCATEVLGDVVECHVDDEEVECDQERRAARDREKSAGAVPPFALAFVFHSQTVYPLTMTSSSQLDCGYGVTWTSGRKGQLDGESMLDRQGHGRDRHPIRDAHPA